MFQELNNKISGLREMKFVTRDELADVVEASGAVPEIIQDDREFTVLAVQTPDQGKVFTVCSVAGANMVLRKGV